MCIFSPCVFPLWVVKSSASVLQSCVSPRVPALLLFTLWFFLLLLLLSWTTLVGLCWTLFLPGQTTFYPISTSYGTIKTSKIKNVNIFYHTWFNNGEKNCYLFGYLIKFFFINSKFLTPMEYVLILIRISGAVGLLFNAEDCVGHIYIGGTNILKEKCSNKIIGSHFYLQLCYCQFIYVLDLLYLMIYSGRKLGIFVINTVSITSLRKFLSRYPVKFTQ